MVAKKREIRDYIFNKLDEFDNDTLLDCEIKKHREKRSKDANAYFHVLVGKIAEKTHQSKIRVKNILIARYGQLEYIDGVPACIKTNLTVDVMLEQEMLHCSPCGVDEKRPEITFFRIYRGSKTYDTREMSVLIDGTVSEAKELGIETMTRAELEKLKNYEASISRK